MQLKQFYNIATKVSSKKSATTFGDLPDCSIHGMQDIFTILFNLKLNLDPPHPQSGWWQFISPSPGLPVPGASPF